MRAVGALREKRRWRIGTETMGGRSCFVRRSWRIRLVRDFVVDTMMY